jgi:hypothetical protein
MIDLCLRAPATQWQAMIDAAISAGLLAQDEDGNLSAVSGAWDYMGTVSVRTGGTDAEPIYETIKDSNGVEYLHANLRTDLPASALSGYYIERAGQPALPVRPRRVFLGTAFAMPDVIIDDWAPEALSEIPAPALPSSGWLEIGAVYRHGDTLLIVRQSHHRTHFEPSATPALFVVKNATENWIAGEQVQVGVKRLFGGVWYEVVQAHVTQADWTPPTVLLVLWKLVEEEPEPGEAWIDTSVTIIQLVAAGVYRCSGIPTIALNQAIRLGDTSAGETVFTGYWPTTGTPSDYIKIAPHVAVANGVKVWKWQ